MDIRAVRSVRRPYDAQFLVKVQDNEFTEPEWVFGQFDANAVESFYSSPEGDSTFVEMDSGQLHQIRGGAQGHASAGLMRLELD